MPLQHITDRMLTAMRRRITARQQEALLEKLRERIPGLAIRTTLITGFPGETEDDHQELLEFVESFGFDMLGVFQYSREEGTPAGTMDLDPALHVPDEVKERREQELMLCQQQIAFENAAYLAEQGSQFDVLIDAVAPRRDGRPVDHRPCRCRSPVRRPLLPPGAAGRLSHVRSQPRAPGTGRAGPLHDRRCGRVRPLRHADRAAREQAIAADSGRMMSSHTAESALALPLPLPLPFTTTADEQ